MSARNTQEQAAYRQALVDYLRHFASTYKAVGVQFEQLGDERGELFRQARDAGMTFAEIAEIFGITIAAVQQRIRNDQQKGARNV